MVWFPLHADAATGTRTRVARSVNNVVFRKASGRKKAHGDTMGEDHFKTVEREKSWD